MRLLFIGPIPPPISGHSLACEVLRDALRDSFDISLVNLSKEDLRSGLMSFGRVLEIVRLLRETSRNAKGADVAYLTISESLLGNLKDLAIYALLFPKLKNLVIHLHGGSIGRDIFDRYPLLKRLNRFFIRRMGAVVILGETHRKIFQDMTAPDRVHIVRNFAQDFLFADEVVVRAKFQAAGDTVRILFLSNFIAGKGHDVLLKAYTSLEPDIQQRVFVDFAGSFERPEDREAFLAVISNYPNITYHGGVAGAVKKKLLHDAQVFCLPTSLSEGQPISILEAYASGCAVVTTLSGGIGDVFTPGQNGYGVEPGAISSLADTIRRIISEPRVLETLGLHNLKLAAQNYRAAGYAERLRTILIRAARVQTTLSQDGDK